MIFLRCPQHTHTFLCFSFPVQFSSPPSSLVVVDTHCPHAHRQHYLAEIPVPTSLTGASCAGNYSPSAQVRGAVRAARLQRTALRHAAAHTMKGAVAGTSLVWLASLGGSLSFVAVPPSARPRSSFSGDELARVGTSPRLARVGAPSRCEKGVVLCMRVAESQLKCRGRWSLYAALACYVCCCCVLRSSIASRVRCSTTQHGHNPSRWLCVVIVSWGRVAFV